MQIVYNGTDGTDGTDSRIIEDTDILYRWQIGYRCKDGMKRIRDGTDGTDYWFVYESHENLRFGQQALFRKHSRLSSIILGIVNIFGYLSDPDWNPSLILSDLLWMRISKSNILMDLASDRLQ